MFEQESIQEAAKEFELVLKDDDFANNRLLLAERINNIAQRDFQKLLTILYRVDVSEEKLRGLLKLNTGSDAGIIIADLIIEREMQKIRSRQQFNQQNTQIDENEKW